MLSIKHVIGADVDQKDSAPFALLCQVLGKINVDPLCSHGIFFYHFGEANRNTVDNIVRFYVIQQGIHFFVIPNVDGAQLPLPSRVASSDHLHGEHASRSHLYRIAFLADAINLASQQSGSSKNKHFHHTPN